MKYGTGFLLLAAVACSSGGGDAAPLALGPTIELERRGAGWTARPVVDDLAENSNNGFGYTGEIDRYEMPIPTTGRLQIVLQWEQEANLDVIVAEDPEAETRLAESNTNATDHEFVKVDVRAGQTVWIFVAGWEGEAGAYELDTLLLPEEIPPFRPEAMPLNGTEFGRDGPILIEFSDEIDPETDVDALAFHVGAAEHLSGEWCLDGRRIVFFPTLPDGSGTTKGLAREGVEYRVAFPVGFGSLRSIHGEYLTEQIDIEHSFRGWNLTSVAEPLRVVSVDPDEPAAWDGGAVRVRFSTPLDPATIVASFRADGTAYPAEVTLRQRMLCDGQADVVVELRPATALPPGRPVELRFSPGLRDIAGRESLLPPSIPLRSPS